MSSTPLPAHAPAFPAAGARRAEAAAGLLLALLVGWFYLWSALQPAGSWVLWGRNAEGYYTMETQGFRTGHLYVALAPHPKLLALADPYDPVANAPYRVHDMTLYKGHYYLYFGVTPAIILFWPVAAITGRYVAEPAAVAFFCIAAVWVGMGLLLAIKRRHFPAAPWYALVMGWVCLAWATPLVLLVEGPQFYQVPISCAIFLQALMLAAIFGALHSPRRKLLWMGAAGLAFGLAIGARPNYLACSVALVVPVAAYAASEGRGKKGRLGALSRALVWTFSPALACGVGILAFNYARFGSVSEFGMHYQLGGERFTGLKAISLARLVPHARDYLFGPGNWQSYFPYFSPPSGQPYGFLRYLPWAWLAAAALLRPRPGEPGERAGLWLISGAVAAAALSNLAFLACFFGTTARYPGDFGNAALILSGVGALALGQRMSRSRQSAAFRLGVAALAAVSLGFSLAVYVGGFPKPDLFSGVARAANWPAYAWGSAHGSNFGGLRLELVLPEHPPDVPEPLFETGIQSDQRDWLQISYLSPNRARLAFFHAGTGAFTGAEFEVPGNRRLTVEARCGSLLPPFSTPGFSSWSRREFDLARRELQVTVNGVEVLKGALDCYPSSPANLTIGRLEWFSGGMKQAFSGTVVAVSRLPLAKPVPPAAVVLKPDPVEIALMLPAAPTRRVEPLLVTGEGKQSDLLVCAYDGTDRVSFGLDHYGGGGPQSESVAYDPLAPHKLVVWMGSMADPRKPGAGPGGELAPDRFVVIFDGKVMINTDQVFFPSGPDAVLVGLNPYHSTVAGSEFTGRVLGVRQVDPSELPRRQTDGAFGAVDMTVRLPVGVPGTQEPLVVTGVTGAGDMVYIRYVDATHVALGFDHWGVGGNIGDPVEVDYRENHQVSVRFQSLFQPGTEEGRSDLVDVRLDGKPVLVRHWPCHPATEDRIYIGRNPIGGSTCGPNFTGRILHAEHLAHPGR